MRSLASLPPLPETREEVRNVSSTFNEDEKVKLFGLQATEIDWRLSNPSKFSILHFATHGLTSKEMVEINEPALVLSQNGAIRSSMNDGLLTATEIAELDLQGSTAILSACETAIDFGNEKLLGIDGLASAFIFAGTERVFATQWKVETNSAARLVSGIAEFSNLRKTMQTEERLNPHPFFGRHF